MRKEKGAKTEHRASSEKKAAKMGKKNLHIPSVCFFWLEKIPNHTYDNAQHHKEPAKTIQSNSSAARNQNIGHALPTKI